MFTCGPSVEWRCIKLIIVVAKFPVCVCEPKYDVGRNGVWQALEDVLDSCKPQNIACIVESIGAFVADISVVATWNDLSHDVTILMDSQSALLSSKVWISLFWET